MGKIKKLLFLLSIFSIHLYSSDWSIFATERAFFETGLRSALENPNFDVNERISFDKRIELYPLTYACSIGNVELVQELLKKPDITLDYEDFTCFREDGVDKKHHVKYIIERLITYCWCKDETSSAPIKQYVNNLQKIKELIKQFRSKFSSVSLPSKPQIKQLKVFDRSGCC